MPESASPSTAQARFFEKVGEMRWRCCLCPRECIISSGKRGVCFGRVGGKDGLELPTYGRVSGIGLDPIEKKPLYHFFPGRTILSFGTVGCNLTCKFCQNWHISRAQDDSGLRGPLTPTDIASAAKREGAVGVAFTYNEPIVFAEYVMDTAAECRRQNLRTVAVTAGYISERARAEFFADIDAANVDLKYFNEDSYRRWSGVEMKPILANLEWLATKTRTWLEITTLIVPGLNDSSQEIDALTKWIRDHLGPHVPLHFSAFHPDYHMTDRGPTPVETLLAARDIARTNGLQHVYLGNVRGTDGSDTCCAKCHAVVIERTGRSVDVSGMDGGKCRACGERVTGVWE